MNVTVKLTLEDVKPLISDTLRSQLALNCITDTLDINIEVPNTQVENSNMNSNINLRKSNKIYLIKMIREAQMAFTMQNGIISPNCMPLYDAKVWVEKYCNID